MGGMALGSWVCSRYSVRWKNLLVGYALTEGIIGLFALGFHAFFVLTVQLSYNSIIPQFGSPAAANAYKWIVSGLLIAPQSVLLGMTFPLMSAGVLRVWPQNQGRTISLLYFTNSIGAAAGVLASGFLFIRLVGLPGTIQLAGLINLCLALFVWRLVKRQDAQAINNNDSTDKRLTQPTGNQYFLFLFAAFITGAASFIYEISWIRMLSLVMGSSTHAFELMLSAFILGLAFGGLWIQHWIDRIAVPARYLAAVQVVMGLFALSTLALYGTTFDIMRWLVNTIDRSSTGYILFNLSGNAIALLIMLPATFCAGMTLPLITYALIKQGHGERSIGAVYAANTIGAIVGVFFAIHVGLPIFGLKGLITIGAGCDIALGIMLFWVAAAYTSSRKPAIITAISVCAVAAAFFLFNLDPYKMASEVFRTGELMTPADIEFKYYRDGKTATISTFLERHTGIMAINTNGKTDASINMALNGVPSGDEPTMILAAVLPMAFYPDARTVANIGLGSGLTTHTLLGNPRLQRVDTVEIEGFVVEAAKYFRPRVELVYTDPRSAIFIDDAKTFFSVHKEKYDIIISEPSNPWVSGVSGLFSEEFYRRLKQNLTENGLFVQWIHLYEINTDIVISVLKAVSRHFSDFVIYAAHDRDMLIIAKKNGQLEDFDRSVFKLPAITTALERVYIKGVQDMELRKIGNRKFLNAMIESYPIRANSDYYPVVDQSAARARFLQSNAYGFHNLSNNLLPALEMLQGSGPSWTTTDVAFPSLYVKSQSIFTAMALRDYSLHGNFGPRYGNVPRNVQQQALEFRNLFYQCRSQSDRIDRHAGLFNASVSMVPYLRPQELEAVWKKMEAGPCVRSLSSAEKNWIALFKAIGRRDAVAMVRGAKSVLENEQGLGARELQFLVASGMTGSLMQGDKDGSFRLWSAYRSQMFANGQPDLLFRLLTAESATN